MLALVAFWTLVTNHCALEAIPGLGLLACSPQGNDAVPHEPTDCGDEDACAAVESGFYKSEEGQVSAKKPFFASAAFVLAALSQVTAAETAAGVAVPVIAGPELAHTWQFSFRTALPPRAPSFLS